MHDVPWTLRGAFALVLAGLVALAVAAGGGSGEEATFGGTAPEAALEAAQADPIPYDGRSPAPLEGDQQRVLVELPRPALGELDDVPSMSPRAQRRYVASLEDEADALLSALEARGVQTRDVVRYARVWHGFAATVDAKDLPGLQSLGVRLRADRRLYPALSQPVAVGPLTRVDPPAGAPTVAVLAGGAAGREGYDAVSRDGSPEPVPGEAGGTALADELARLGVTPRVVRVSALRRAPGLATAEEFARADELLDGLEHVVDRNGDGDTADHEAVALVGVNAPYAGFADAPEAEAVAGAQRLGTLVVAPSGHEGAGSGAYGTVGSPGAGVVAVGVGPRTTPGAVARTRLTVGAVTVDGAALLAGAPPARELQAAPAGETALVGRLAVVEAGEHPAAAAADAAAAGAAAVLLAEPREDRALPAMPAGRVQVPVLGVTGDAAEAVLALRSGVPARARGVRYEPGDGDAASPAASTGPSFEGLRKPELMRSGVTVAGGRLVAGAAVAAAVVVAEAARRDEPDAARARQLLLEGAGGAAQEVPPAPQIAVGTPQVRQEDGSTGVTFTVGTFERRDPLGGAGTLLVPAERVDLTLREANGALVERLTPAGGERGVLPGEYAYTLRAAVVEELAGGSYVFRVTARAPRQKEPTVATSEPFEVS